jgi:tRNA-splicing ligase RtcB/Glycosyltransferase family 20
MSVRFQCTEAFAQEARAAEKNSTVKRMLASLDGRPLVIGVDRLDYSKGLKQRMEAFATFLERSPQAARARVTMLKITPEEAGRINGKHGDVDWILLRYINKSISHSARRTLSHVPHRPRHALARWHEPRRQEYVAAQAPDNPGALVLSQFSAGGVGFDISCGVRTMLTNLPVTDIMNVQNALADSLFQNIPAGVGSKSAISLDLIEMDLMLAGRWAVERGWGERRDLERIEERGAMAGAKPEMVSERAKERQRREMGTLGSGNHYLEVQAVAEILMPQC